MAVPKKEFQNESQMVPARLCLFVTTSQAELDRKLYQKIWPSIVRVHAVMEQGKTASGSGIVVAAG